MVLGGRASARELARLVDLLGRLDESGPRLAWIEGPRGVGKGQLVRSFVAEARDRGAVVLEGRARDGEPFAIVEGVIRGAVSVLGRKATEAHARALACSDGCCTPWFRHVARESVDPELAGVERRLHFDALCTLVESVALLAPTVVALEGLDCAGAEVSEMVERLLARSAAHASGTPPRLLVVTSVVEDDDSRFATLRHDARTVRLPLAGLGEQALRELLASPEVVARILARTAGVPSAVERLLDSEAPTPEEHLARKVARLGAEARASLDALAVLGTPASVPVVARVAQLEPASSAVGELLDAGLAVESGDLVALADAGDRQRLVEKLPPEWRAMLHRRAAVWCEGDGALAEAARHAVQGNDRERAERLCARAADDLAAQHAHRDAVVLLDEIARGLGGSIPASLEARLADGHVATGDFRAAVRHGRRAAVLAPDDLEATRRLGRALVLAGDLESAAQVIGDAGARARSSADDAAALGFDAVLAELAYQRGRLDEAERRAAAIGVRPGRAGAVAELEALQTYAKVALARGALDEACLRYRAYEARAGELGDAAHRALAVGGLGVALLTDGRLDEAERALKSCAKLAEKARSHKGRALASHNLAVVAHLRHDYVTARARYEEAIRHLSAVGNRASLARAAFNLGELYETFGDSARARSMCDYGAQVGGSDVAPRATAEGLLLRGRLELAEDGLDAARAAFEGARSLLAALDPIRGAAATLGLARVAIRDGRVDEASELLASVPGGVPPRRRADLDLARAELARARGDRFVDAARAAVESAEHADDDALLLESLVTLGGALLAAGELRDARTVLERASRFDAELAARVPDDLVSAWDDRPVRRALLALLAGGAARVEPVPVLARSCDGLGIVGDSDGMRRVLGLVERVGPSGSSVLIRGESGTGKELVARALHLLSPRATGPLVAVNCAALVDSLLLSELFGHEKGAFTGALERKQGRFELAHGGTLFLDEIGDVSPAVQAALLRVLQERRFERVGGTRSISVDVRVIAATNRDLEAMVEQGTFREDLYYRLNAVVVALPPLREHPEDIPALVEHLLARLAEEHGRDPKTLTPRALRAVLGHAWPGNVRQLENVLRAATLFSEGPCVDEDDLEAAGLRASGRGADCPFDVSISGRVEGSYARLRDGELTLRDLKKEIERELIERALSDCDGNISRAAGLLGMKRPRLSQLVKEYGLRSGEDG